MSKTITLNLSDDRYALFQTYAQTDNRSLENMIETYALRYIEEHEYVDELEMNEIDSNSDLQASLQRALQEAKAGKGRLVE